MNATRKQLNMEVMHELACWPPGYRPHGGGGAAAATRHIGASCAMSKYDTIKCRTGANQARLAKRDPAKTRRAKGKSNRP